MSGTAALIRATGGVPVSAIVRMLTTSLAVLPAIWRRFQDCVTPASDVTGVPPSQFGGGGAPKPHR